MAQMLQITHDEVHRLATEIRRKNDEAKMFMSNVQNVVHQATTVWKGEASDKFASEYQSLQKQILQQLGNFLDSLSQTLITVDQQLQEADKRAASGIKLHE